MIFPKTKKIAKELNWYTTSNAAFGMYEGYFFNIGDGSLLSNPQYKYVIATTDNLTEDQKVQIETALKANKKSLRFSNFEISSNSLYFQFLESLTFTKVKTIYALFDFLVDLFIKLNIPGQNKCHNCGAKERIGYYNFDNRGTIFCTTCFRDIENRLFEAEREKSSEEKNYLTGFLGSLFLSVPGVIAWALIAVYLNVIVSAMSIAIAFLGFKGYVYFKGRQGKWTRYLIIISNIISIVIANVATIIIMLINEGLTLGQALVQLQTNEVVQNMLFKNTLISFVLAFFVWIWLFFLLKDQKPVIKPAEKFVGQSLSDR
ncbi:MAG: hypothetical protein ACTHMM_19865 [Agriterribacter sp.]